MNIFKKLNVYKGLPRSIYILFIVRVINAMGNFVYPFLTLFLTERLGLSAKAAGTYFMLSAFSQSFGSIIGGKLTDHFGRKKLFIIFQALAAACFLPCSLLGNSLLIPKLLIVSGIFSGAAQPANSAMMTDLTNKENRKQAFSLLYLGINVGFAIGPMIAGFLYRRHTSWIFLGNGFSIIISLILLMIFVEETLPNQEEIINSKAENDDESADEGSVINALLRRPMLLLFLVGKTINQFIYSTIGFAIPIQFSRIFGNDLGPKNFGLLMSFTGLVVITCTMPITRLTIKLKPIINMSFAGFVYAVGFGMMGFVDKFYLFLVSGFIFTIGEILEATNSGVYVANHSPITHRGRFNAIIPLVTGLGATFGPYVFGRIIDRYGMTNLWVFCFALEAISGIFMAWLAAFEVKMHSKRESC